MLILEPLGDVRDFFLIGENFVEQVSVGDLGILDLAYLVINDAALFLPQSRHTERPAEDAYHRNGRNDLHTTRQPQVFYLTFAAKN